MPIQNSGDRQVNNFIFFFVLAADYFLLIGQWQFFLFCLFVCLFVQSLKSAGLSAARERNRGRVSIVKKKKKNAEKLMH